MNTDKELMRFIRAAVKNGGSVDISFYQAGNHITASVENAYMMLPNEDEEWEELDIITLTPAPGENAETTTIIRGKEEKEVEEKETLF